MSKSRFRHWRQKFALGLEIGPEAVQAVSLCRRGGRVFLMGRVSLPLSEQAREAELVAKIEEAVLGLQPVGRRDWLTGPPRVSVVVPRNLALVREVTVPPLKGRALRAAVAMQLSQLLPYPVAEADFGFYFQTLVSPRPSLAGWFRSFFEKGQAQVAGGGSAPPEPGPRQVLVAAVRREESERLLALCREAGLEVKELFLSTSVFGLAGARTALPTAGAVAAPVLFLEKAASRLTVVLWEEGRERWSRQIDASASWREELAASLAYLKEEGLYPARVWVSGELEPGEMRGLVHAPVERWQPWRFFPVAPSLRGSVSEGGSLAALGAALAGLGEEEGEAVFQLLSGREPPVTPWREWWNQNWRVAGLVGLLLLLGGIWGGMRLALAREEARLARLETAVSGAEVQTQLAVSLQQAVQAARRERDRIKELQGDARYLAFLRGIAAAYPEGSFLTHLSLEGESIRELGGVSPDAAALLLRLRAAGVGEALMPLGPIVLEDGWEKYTFTGRLNAGGGGRR